MNALVLNPALLHVWSYAEASLACNQQLDQIPLLKQRDPRIFGERFELIDPEDMPEPDGLSCRQLLTKTSSSWTATL
jgi:hypothetical protein